MAVTLGLIAGGSGYFAWQQRGLAVAASVRTEAALIETREQRTRAETESLRAQESRDQALLIQSLFLADLSRQQTAQGSTTIALHLALHALEDDRPITIEAQGALLEALIDHREEAVVATGSEAAR